MTKPKIIVYNPWPELTTYMKKKLNGLSCIIRNEKLTEETIDPKIEVLVVFIESAVTKSIMQKMPKLKHIVTMSTGYDHIDLATAKKQGISISNVPSYGENTVAEHTFALLLGLARKLFASVKRVKEGRYDFEGLRGVDLMGKTIGIIGTGHIGAHVARMAKGFEMNVLAYDLKPNKKLARTLQFSYVPLPMLLKQSDIVSLHTPLFKETYHLLNKKKFA